MIGAVAVAAGLMTLSAGAPSALKDSPKKPFYTHRYGRAPEERGLALGLFSADPSYSYRMLIDEVANTGATHISIVWVWWQDDVRAQEIKYVSGWSATDAQILEALREAKRHKLHVTAFPIVRLMKSTSNEWRGKIAPEDPDVWWRSYNEFMHHNAQLAKLGGADRLCVGSELLSMEKRRERWLDVIDRVRVTAPDVEVLYSANWDHFEPVSFWDAIDVVGMTGYWELTRDMNATTEDLLLSWQSIKPSVLDWLDRIGKPVVITEIGYPSLDGGAAWPWDETRKAPVDLEEQRRAYDAFARAWSDTPQLSGVYFWNWFGFGGEKDGNYTPRGKPAADVIRRWYRTPK